MTHPTNPLDLHAPVDTLAMTFTREFDAPVPAVFRAHADPELVTQWLGPHAIRMDIEEWDFAPGGRYRYVHENEHGRFGFHGVYHAVRLDDVIIQTFEYDGVPDSVNLEYLWFEDLGDGRSRLRGRSICPDVHAREALLASGMETGMAESYERLDVVLRDR